MKQMPHTAVGSLIGLPGLKYWMLWPLKGIRCCRSRVMQLVDAVEAQIELNVSMLDAGPLKEEEGQKHGAQGDSRSEENAEAAGGAGNGDRHEYSRPSDEKDLWFVRCLLRLSTGETKGVMSDGGC